MLSNLVKKKRHDERRFCIEIVIIAPSITAAVSVVKRDAGDNGRVWPDIGDTVASVTKLKPALGTMGSTRANAPGDGVFQPPRGSRARKGCYSFVPSAHMTAPCSFYAQAIQNGRITDGDLEAALAQGSPFPGVAGNVFDIFG